MKRIRNKRARTGRFRRGLGNIFLWVGAILIISSISLVLYNMWDSNRAAREAADILRQLEEIESERNPDETEMRAPAPKKRTDVDVDDRVGDTGPDWLEDSNMTTANIGGYSYIGTIEIPSQGIRLPVMSTWDYERLKVSPCRYSGSYYTDDMVICAHNYASHFSPIKWVALGADVYFTTVDGVVYHYVVTNRETVKPTAIDQMIGSVDEDSWDLTLFTCNTGGQTRCAVRCVRG